MADRHLEVNEKHTMMYELHDEDGKVKKVVGLGKNPTGASICCSAFGGECPRVRCRCGRGDGV